MTRFYVRLVRFVRALPMLWHALGRPQYVVVYDVPDERGTECSEEYYGYFPTAEDARDMFREAYPQNRDETRNVKICLRVQDLTEECHD